MTREELEILMEKDYKLDPKENDNEVIEYVSREKKIMTDILGTFVDHHISYNGAVLILDRAKEIYLGRLCKM